MYIVIGFGTFISLLCFVLWSSAAIMWRQFNFSNSQRNLRRAARRQHCRTQELQDPERRKLQPRCPPHQSRDRRVISGAKGFWGRGKTFFEEKAFSSSPSPNSFSKNLFLPFWFLKNQNGDSFFKVLKSKINIFVELQSAPGTVFPENGRIFGAWSGFFYKINKKIYFYCQIGRLFSFITYR